MKLSVSIPEQDVEFMDEYADQHGIASRSAVVQRALSLLRVNDLGAAYAAAWAEWTSSDEGLWAAADSDGLEAAAG